MFHDEAVAHQVGANCPRGDPEQVQARPLKQIVGVAQKAHEPEPDGLARHDDDGADHSGLAPCADVR